MAEEAGPEVICQEQVEGQARAHPHVPTLKTISFILLPPNTTSISQSMDQGIIANLK